MAKAYWKEFEKNQKKISTAQSLAKAAGLTLERVLYFTALVAPLVIEGIKLIPLAQNPATLPYALIKFSLETCHVASELYQEFSNDSGNKNAHAHKKRT